MITYEYNLVIFVSPPIVALFALVPLFQFVGNLVLFVQIVFIEVVQSDIPVVHEAGGGVAVGDTQRCIYLERERDQQ